MPWLQISQQSNSVPVSHQQTSEVMDYKLKVAEKKMEKKICDINRVVNVIQEAQNSNNISDKLHRLQQDTWLSDQILVISDTTLHNFQ